MLSVFRVLAVSVTIVIALCVGSCGDSDKSTGTTGDNNDPRYLLMRGMVDSVIIPIANGFVSDGVEKGDGLDSSDLGADNYLGKRAAVQDDSMSIIYYPFTGWWVAYLSLTEESDGKRSSLILRDSLQFKNAQGHIQIIPNDSTDFFTDIVRLHPLEYSDNTTTVSVFTRSYLTFDNLQSAVLTVNGVFNLTLFGIGLEGIDTTGELVDGRVAVDYVIDDLTVPVPEEGETACPTSGVLTFTATENFSSQLGGGPAQDITWSVRITIDDEATYRVQITLGSTTYPEYTILNPCDLSVDLGKRAPEEMKRLTKKL